MILTEICLYLKSLGWIGRLMKREVVVVGFVDHLSLLQPRHLHHLRKEKVRCIHVVALPYDNDDGRKGQRAGCQEADGYAGAGH